MLDIISWLVEAVNNPLMISILLGMLPISEIRGAAIYAFSVGQPMLLIPAAIANMAIAPLILLFWDVVNIPYWGKTILGEGLNKRLRFVGEKYEKQGLIAIILLVGIPLPVTGVYTATLLAKLLGISNKHIIYSSVVGVSIATILMYLLLGGFSGLGLLG